MKSCAYAKINLCLIITGIENGYHLLDSVMASCKNLKDTVIVKKSKKDSIKFLGKFSDIDPQNNTVYKTLTLFREKGFDIPPLDIKIKKRIPIMAGLGGSSADAACFIKIICKMFKLSLSDPKILEIAKTAGSDIPYMLNTRPCRVKGTGNIIQPLKNNFKLKAIIAMSGTVSTKQSFQAFDELGLEGSDKTHCDNITKALENADFELLKNNLVNDLEKASCYINPKIVSAKELLKAAGAEAAAMTGSGGAFFALARNNRVLNKIYKSLKGKVRFLYKTEIF
ncbi:MAG TPA: 4-(cytidine 5'-diphospho)-2-C-methyl-D-erythritol kinase [Clostridia bacterium]